MSEKQVEGTEHITKEDPAASQESMANRPRPRGIVYIGQHRGAITLRFVSRANSFIDVFPNTTQDIGGILVAHETAHESKAPSTEEEAMEEMQTECLELSEYIHDNIVDILKIREESDRLSEKLRGAMAKLKAA